MLDSNNGKKLSRRALLRGGLSAAMLAHTPGLSITQAFAQPAPFNDYRALVCVFLFGGNDSFNMLVPASTPEYNVYAASRQNLAIAQADLLPITPLNPDGAQYGLHPTMGALQNLFESGQAAFVANMGPLIEPTTKLQYQTGSVNLPPQLFSHNDQQDQWHSLRGKTPSSTGWGGRVADLLRLSVSGQQLGINTSVFGNSLFQAGEDSLAYTMGPSGPLTFDGMADSGPGLEQRRAFEAINENVELRTIVSMRVSSLLLGRFVFHAARCRGGPGRLILRTRGRPATADQVQRSIPINRLVAWNSFTRFSVDSHLTRRDVFFNSFNLRRIASETDAGDNGILVVEADARDGGILFGTMRFARHFLLPI